MSLHPKITDTDQALVFQPLQSLLKTLVERYISDGQPVGSRTLSKYSGLDLSPATIRNVMADLEDLGFIASPHTSAGRVPTPKRSAAFQHVEFMTLSDKRLLLIVVTPDGDVQNRILFTDRTFSPSELAQASNFLNQNYAGCTLDEIRVRIRDELGQLHQDMSVLMMSAIEASSRVLAESGEDVVVSGEHKLLKVQDLSSNMANLRKLFDLFEQKTVLLRLLDASRNAHGVQIFIGGESGLVSLDEYSVVTAPHEVNGQVVGTIGVVGPTRMAYERVIPIVDITAKLLSSALSQH